MIIKISKEIEDYINKSEYDEDTKNFLMQALLLEFKREKESLRNYTKNYDKLINSYIE